MGIFDIEVGTTTILEEKKEFKAEGDQKKPSVSCFVILEHSDAFGEAIRSYNIDILGTPMFAWVCRACPTIPATIEAEKGTNVLEIIRPYLKDSEYTLVLYSDTPLITRGSVDEILDYMSNKGLNVCKLTRGIVFRTEYIKRVGEIFAPQTYYFDEQDFITAANYKQLAIVTEILKTRILEYHMKNGVNFENVDLVSIDASVTIGRGTKIMGRSCLLGRTEIGENCEIKESIVDNSKVYDNVSLDHANVVKSVIESGSCIEYRTNIVNGSMIGKNTTIGRNSDICKSSVGENAEIGNNCYVAYSRIHAFSALGSRCDLLGQAQKIVRVLGNVKLGDGVRVKAGVMIGEDSVVEDLADVKQNLKKGESI